MKESEMTATRTNAEKRREGEKPSASGDADQRANFRWMLASFAVGVTLMGLKFVGYWVTGSSAILSDALESIINVVASGFGLASVVVAAKPADEDHPYGHGKIEFFSAGVEGALIILAAAGIFVEGARQVLHPRELPHLQTGLIFLIVAGLGNLALGLTLVRVGKRTRSMVLEADGKHLLTDVYTSGAVLVGVALVSFTGWYKLDGIVACLAGANIVFWGVVLLRQSFGGLMHESDPVLLDEICDVLADHRKEIWIDVHRLRAWRSGRRVHVDFHLVLPRELPLKDGHQEVKDLERAFADHFGGMSDILIHLDPCAPPECPVCDHGPCDLRERELVAKRIWRRDVLTDEAIQ